MATRRKKKGYQQKIYNLGKTIEVEKNYIGNYGAPGEPRKAKRKRTDADIERQNEWLAEKNLRRILNANFKEDDWHLIPTFTKDNRPTSNAEARQIIRKFLADIRKDFKKMGKPLKYVCAYEKGERGAPHFHIVINNEEGNGLNTAKIVRKHWKYGKPKLISMDDTGDYRELAQYIIKQTKKVFRDEDAVFKARYTCSKNLERVEPEVEELGRYWSKNTRKIEVPEHLAEQGWYIDADSVIDGINQITGKHYQYYTLRRDERVYNLWKKRQRRINTQRERC